MIIIQRSVKDYEKGTTRDTILVHLIVVEPSQKPHGDNQSDLFIYFLVTSCNSQVTTNDCNGQVFSQCTCITLISTNVGVTCDWALSEEYLFSLYLESPCGTNSTYNDYKWKHLVYTTKRPSMRPSET